MLYCVRVLVRQCVPDAEPPIKTTVLCCAAQGWAHATCPHKLPVALPAKRPGLCGAAHQFALRPCLQFINMANASDALGKPNYTEMETPATFYSSPSQAPASGQMRRMSIEPPCTIYTRPY